MSLSSCLLMGVIASSSPTNSVAAISCGQETHFLHVGDAVERWRVTEISPQYASLQKEQEHIKISIGSGFAESTPLDLKRLGGYEIRDGKLIVSESLRDFIAKEGLVTIIMQACSEPVYDSDGNTMGYRLSEIDKGSAFELAGIQNDDVITEIDGTKMTNPMIALLALGRIKTSKKFTFKYQRAGKEEQRVVEIM